jgi:hypothetical protein
MARNSSIDHTDMVMGQIVGRDGAQWTGTQRCQQCGRPAECCERHRGIRGGTTRGHVGGRGHDLVVRAGEPLDPLDDVKRHQSDEKPSHPRISQNHTRRSTRSARDWLVRPR